MLRLRRVTGQQPDIPLLYAQVEQNEPTKSLNGQTPLHVVLVDTGESE